MVQCAKKSVTLSKKRTDHLFIIQQWALLVKSHLELTHIYTGHHRYEPVHGVFHGLYNYCKILLLI